MKILIVDDEPAICRPLATLLRGDGHEVDTAVSALDGAQKLRDGAFDMALVDFILGDNASMSGATLAAHAPLGTVVFLMTGYPVPEGSRLNMVAKPITHATLRGLVASVKRMNEDTKP